METQAVYEHNSYLKNLKAKIIDIRYKDKIELLFDKTVFYPEGGGQPSDTGYILAGDERVEIIDAQEEEGKIWHTVEKGEHLRIGLEAEQFIDWDKRFQNMQSHSGEHIFSGLLSKYYKANNTGFHIGKDYFTCDYDIELSREKLQEIEILVNTVIQKNIPIDSSYPSQEEIEKIDYRSKKEIDGPIRITAIPEVDSCACCGTHVGSSGEIGYIKLISFERYKKGIRCTLKAGMAAVKYSVSASDIVEEIGRKYSCSMGDVIDRLEKTEKDKETLLNEIKVLKKEKILAVSEKIEKQENLYLKLDADMEDGRVIANELLSKCRNLFLHLNKDQFLIASRKEQAKVIFEEMKENLRGGGSSSMVQGKIVKENENMEKDFYSCVERNLKEEM